WARAGTQAPVDGRLLFVDQALRDHLTAFDIDLELLCPERPEATRLISGQRVRRVERAGMQPDAIRAEVPRLAHRALEQQAAESASDEFRDQAEVVDLDAAVVVAVQLEVARGLAVHQELPHGDPGIREVCLELRVGPLETLV